jgi:hypothetical protein
VATVLNWLTFTESWTYDCARCRTAWQEDYEVQCNGDGHGHEAVLYFRNGQRSVSPWIDHTCPTCLGQGVKCRPASEATKQAKAPVPRPRSDLELIFHMRHLHAY